jgi:hypothetical protein
MKKLVYEQIYSSYEYTWENNSYILSINYIYSLCYTKELWFFSI